MGNNNEKKYDEGTKTEGFPTFEEKNESTADVKKVTPNKPAKETAKSRAEEQRVSFS